MHKMKDDIIIVDVRSDCLGIRDSIKWGIKRRWCKRGTRAEGTMSRAHADALSKI